MKNVNGTIEIKDENGKVVAKLPINQYIDEIMANDHKLVTDVRRAVIFG